MFRCFGCSFYCFLFSLQELAFLKVFTWFSFYITVNATCDRHLLTLMFQLTCITSPFPVKVMLFRLPGWYASLVHVYVSDKRVRNIWGLWDRAVYKTMHVCCLSCKCSMLVNVLDQICLYGYVLLTYMSSEDNIESLMWECGRMDCGSLSMWVVYYAVTKNNCVVTVYNSAAQHFIHTASPFLPLVARSCDRCV